MLTLTLAVLLPILLQINCNCIIVNQLYYCKSYCKPKQKHKITRSRKNTRRGHQCVTVLGSANSHLKFDSFSHIKENANMPMYALPLFENSQSWVFPHRSRFFMSQLSSVFFNPFKSVFFKKINNHSRISKIGQNQEFWGRDKKHRSRIFMS